MRDHDHPWGQPQQCQALSWQRMGQGCALSVHAMSTGNRDLLVLHGVEITQLQFPAPAL